MGSVFIPWLPCVGSIAVRPGYVGPEAGRARGPPVTERGGVGTIAREVALREEDIFCILRKYF